MDLKIGIEGLTEFNRGLRKLDKDAPKGLKVALDQAANLLVNRTRPLVPQRTGAAAKSLKAKSTRTSARVSAGGPKARYYAWLDFGGTVGKGRKAAVATGRGRRRTAGQQAQGGSVRRPYYKEGRYIYPTLRKIRPEIEATLQQALIGVAHDAGLDVG